MRPEKFSVESLTDEPGIGGGALVWKLEVTFPMIRRRKYAIKVECVGCGRGASKFEASDTQKPEVKL